LTALAQQLTISDEYRTRPCGDTFGSKRTPKREAEKPVAASKVLETIEHTSCWTVSRSSWIWTKSRGSYLHNRVDNRRLIDLYDFLDQCRSGLTTRISMIPKYSAICCARRK